MTGGPTPEQLARLPPKLRAKLESKGILGEKSDAKPSPGAAAAAANAAASALSTKHAPSGPQVGPEVTSAPAVGGWVKVKNGESEYWWNPDTGATSWNGPGDAGGEPQ